MKKIYDPVVSLVWSTPEPRKVLSIAGRMTYSAKDVETIAEGITEEETTKTIQAILERHHLSVLRHVSFMFTISGVSRAFSHQLVRHGVGHAYEQRSQHYRTEKDFSLVVPRFEDSDAEQLYVDTAETLQVVYDGLMAAGVPKDDARFILPNGVETQLVWTANLEALYNFIKARACRVNTPEIMSVAIKARKIVLDHIPEMARFLGPTCMTEGICFEGKKFDTHCNKPWRSPSVLWSPDFPLKVDLVGVGGHIKVLNTAVAADLYQPFKVENYPSPTWTQSSFYKEAK